MKYMRRPKSAAVKDIDINIADILGQKYRYCVDIGKIDIDPPSTQERNIMQAGNNFPYPSFVLA